MLRITHVKENSGMLMWLILTLFYIILIITLKVFPDVFLHINTFYALMVFNMIIILFAQYHLYWLLIVIFPITIILLYLIVAFFQHQRTNQRYRFLFSLLCYGLSIIALIIGSYMMITLLPLWAATPFALLCSLANVFLVSWFIYLYMTFLIQHIPPNVHQATILVLGAGIFTESVTPMLKQRLDRAIYFSKMTKYVNSFVVSGGQGPDEPISEALAMKRYLIQQGIRENHITMEDHSTNTYTNMAYSKQYINEYPHPVVIVTSEFHILRALRLAQRHHIRSLGYGAPSPIVFRATSLIRDYSGLLFQYPITWSVFGILVIIIKLVLQY
ncbi:YdcF family protein [Staphylococcus canis]|nr:YdcF family protein [Staphylococcus canis]